MLPETYVEAKRWLRFAEDDLAAAQMHISNLPLLPNQACYHSHQAAEKALKSVLILFGVRFPRTHDLTALASCLSPELMHIVHDLDLVDLTSWAVTARYPGDWPEASLEDARFAVATAERIVCNCKTIL